jgi:hypothetical protein
MELNADLLSMVITKYFPNLVSEEGEITSPKKASKKERAVLDYLSKTTNGGLDSYLPKENLGEGLESVEFHLKGLAYLLTQV